MIRLFGGTDTYASYHAARDRATEEATTRGFALTVLEADELTVNQLADQLQTLSFFSAGQVFLLKRVLDNKQIVDYLTDHLASLSTQEIICWQPGSVDGRLSFTKKLKEQKLLQLFDQEKVWEVANWTYKEAQSRKVTLSKEQAQIIAETVAGDKWRIDNELQKLSLYLETHGKQRLDTTEIQLLVAGSTELEIWGLLDALSGSNKAAVLTTLNRLLMQGENEQYLITMLHREVMLLARVLHAQQRGLSTQKLGLHSFVLEKTTQKVRKYTLDKLTKLANALVRLDVAIKAGKMDPDVGLFLFLLVW